jgi:hypothetical protein
MRHLLSITNANASVGDCTATTMIKIATAKAIFNPM